MSKFIINVITMHTTLITKIFLTFNANAILLNPITNSNMVNQAIGQNKLVYHDYSGSGWFNTDFKCYIGWQAIFNVTKYGFLGKWKSENNNVFYHWLIGEPPFIGWKPGIAFQTNQHLLKYQRNKVLQEKIARISSLKKTFDHAREQHHALLLEFKLDTDSFGSRCVYFKVTNQN